jgi:hypothetical protein
VRCLDDTRLRATRLRATGYEYLYWFKSLAALGSPAPRVLAPLRAASPDRHNNRAQRLQKAAATRLGG